MAEPNATCEYAVVVYAEVATSGAVSGPDAPKLANQEHC